MVENWKLDETLKQEYVLELKRAVGKGFKDFKKQPKMSVIVENTYPASGVECLNHIKEYYSQYLTSEKLNQIIEFEKNGSPETFFTEYGMISGTTLRYIMQTAIIEKYLGSLDKMIIGEIGAGYGGLATIINAYFTPKKYIVFDIPEALELQKKYFLECIGKELTVANLATKTKNYDLIIASCSWSELEHDLKIEYLKNVITKAKAGFFILNWNRDVDIELLKTVLKDKTFEIHDKFGFVFFH